MGVLDAVPGFFPQIIMPSIIVAKIYFFLRDPHVHCLGGFGNALDNVAQQFHIIQIHMYVFHKLNQIILTFFLYDLEQNIISFVPK